VVVIRKEPQQESKDSLFNGDSPSRHAAFSTKISNAFEHGAAAVIMVNDGLQLARGVSDAKKSFDEVVDRLVEVRQKFKEQDPSAHADRPKHVAEISQLAEQIALLSKRQSENPDAPLAFDGAGMEGGRRTFPVVFCSREPIDEMVKAVFGRDLDAIEKQIDESLSHKAVP
jgi:hypothetical protein